MVNFCQAIKTKVCSTYGAFAALTLCHASLAKKKNFVWLSLCNFHCFWSQEPTSAKCRLRRDDGSVVTWGDPSIVVAMLPRWEVGASHGSVMFNYCQNGHSQHILWFYLVLWFLTPQLCRKCFFRYFFVGSEENPGVSLCSMEVDGQHVFRFSK